MAETKTDCKECGFPKGYHRKTCPNLNHPKPEEAASAEHMVAENEERNGWHYIHCICGVVVGPFHDRSYAEDAFDNHTQPAAKLEAAPLPQPDVVCGNSNHGWKARMKCVLPKGHTGNHEDSTRCWWR